MEKGGLILPELRRNPVTSNWVIISTERSKRPSDFVKDEGNDKEREHKSDSCPFCYGNEDKTPPEVLAYRENDLSHDTSGWSVRVVPNKFPALRKEESPPKRRPDSLMETIPGYGIHEVIIESPDHSFSLGEYSQEQTEKVITALLERYREIRKDPFIRHIQIFKNSRAIAGASLSHPHFQLIATPLIPSTIDQELLVGRSYYVEHSKCIYCSIIEEEMKSKQRLIEENEGFVAICPHASRFPFETWFLPKEHASAFDSIEEGDISRLAAILKGVMGRFEELLNAPPYNLILHTAPLDLESGEYYHWHLELLPRLTIVAGFEWGTNFYINPTPPESAAKFLRDGAFTKA